jgi:hypothetical protein
MKSHIIEIDRLDGMADVGIQIELSGAMQVRLDPQPLDGVYESKLLMSRADAAKLVGWLTAALQRNPPPSTR